VGPTATSGRSERVGVRHVAQLEPHLRSVYEVRQGAAREVVESDDVEPVGDQSMTKVRADEPGGTGDQDTFPHPPSQALSQVSPQMICPAR
jgi:hypothetical protein